MKIAFLFALAGIAAAGIWVKPPLLGTARDCAGNAYHIFGVSGSFIVERSPGHRASPTPARLPEHVTLPGPAAAVERLGPDWLAAWPYAIRLTGDGAEIHRLPVPACGGRR